MSQTCARMRAYTPIRCHAMSCPFNTWHGRSCHATTSKCLGYTEARGSTPPTHRVLFKCALLLLLPWQPLQPLESLHPNHTCRSRRRRRTHPPHPGRRGIHVGWHGSWVMGHNRHVLCRMMSEARPYSSACVWRRVGGWVILRYSSSVLGTRSVCRGGSSVHVPVAAWCCIQY